MANWYLLRNSQSCGPYPEETIRQWIRTGQITANEKLAREGNANWLAQDKIAEFEADFWAAPESPTSAPMAPPTPVPTAQTPPPPQPSAAAPQYQPPQYYVMPGPQAYAVVPGAHKDKTVAGLFALLLGGAGVHHFYLGNVGLGVGYLVAMLSGVVLSTVFIGLLWVWIPAVLALIEGIIFLTIPEDRFQRNYRNWFCSGP